MPQFSSIQEHGWCRANIVLLLLAPTDFLPFSAQICCRSTPSIPPLVEERWDDCFGCAVLLNEPIRRFHVAAPASRYRVDRATMKVQLETRSLLFMSSYTNNLKIFQVANFWWEKLKVIVTKVECPQSFHFEEVSRQNIFIQIVVR